MLWFVLLLIFVLWCSFSIDYLVVGYELGIVRNIKGFFLFGWYFGICNWLYCGGIFWVVGCSVVEVWKYDLWSFVEYLGDVIFVEGL